MKKLLLSILAMVSMTVFAIEPLWHVKSLETVPALKKHAPLKAETETGDYIHGQVSGTLSDCIGVQSALTYYAWVRIPAEMSTKFAGCKISSIDAALGTASKAKANFRILVTNNVFTAGDPSTLLVDQAMTPVIGSTNYGAKWSSYDFTEENTVTLEAGKEYFVGYAIYAASNQYPIGANYDQTPGINDILTASNSTQYGQIEMGDYGLAIGVHITGDLPQFCDLAFLGYQMPKYVRAGEPIKMGLAIRNDGTKKVDTYDLVYSLDNGAEVVLPQTGAIASKETAEVWFDIPTTEDMDGDVVVGIEARNLNGGADVDDDPTNNAFEATTNVHHMPYRSAVLLENFTGQTCPNCPAGHEKIHAAVELVGEENVSWICHHAGYYDDSFTLSESKTITKLFNNGGSTYAPALAIDRTVNDLCDSESTCVLFPQNSEAIADVIKEYLASPALIALDAHGYYDKDNNKMVITVNSEKLGETRSGANLRLNVFVTEDGIVASQQGGGSAYVHNGVLRAVPTTAWGKAFNWDSENKDTQTYEVSFAGKDWKKWNLNVTVFASYYNSRNYAACEVLNTIKVDMDEVFSGVDEVKTDKEGRRVVYTNNEEIIIPGAYSKATVYGLDGRLIGNVDGRISVPAGLYVVNIDGEAVKVLVK
mgnify:FL=1